MSPVDSANPALPADFDYIKSPVISDKPGQVLFKDKQYLCPIGWGAGPGY